MWRIFNKLLLLGLAALNFPSHAALNVDKMPSNFVKLSSIAPHIIQSQRYATSENFLGRTMIGYHHEGVLCTRPLALALKKVNAVMNKKGYTLVVYDAYRPQETVDSFIAWGKTETDQVGKSKYYPTIPKYKLFELGYLFAKSGHTRGSTVDLSIIPLKKKLKPVAVLSRTLQNGEVIPFLDDNTVDMGSSFDLFHTVSHHDTNLITPEQARMRDFLYSTMLANGFAGLPEEWWHYTLVDEPYPDTYFNFPT